LQQAGEQRDERVEQEDEPRPLGPRERDGRDADEPQEGRAALRRRRLAVAQVREVDAVSVIHERRARAAPHNRRRQPDHPVRLAERLPRDADAEGDERRDGRQPPDQAQPGAHEFRLAALVKRQRPEPRHAALDARHERAAEQQLAADHRHELPVGGEVEALREQEHERGVRAHHPELARHHPGQLSGAVAQGEEAGGDARRLFGYIGRARSL
jgi:hypothetical protein